jgi:hypothetical protein
MVGVAVLYAADGVKLVDEAITYGKRDRKDRFNRCKFDSLMRFGRVRMDTGLWLSFAISGWNSFPARLASVRDRTKGKRILNRHLCDSNTRLRGDELSRPTR